MLRRDAHTALDSVKAPPRAGMAGARPPSRPRDRSAQITSHPRTAAGRSSSTGARRQPNCSHWPGRQRPLSSRTATPASARARWPSARPAGAAASSPDATQALCVNLRHLPATSLELEAHLGAPLAELLAELSAPQRLLVIDGADAVSEGAENVFRYLADAARQADVTVIAVTANDARQLVRDTVAECCGGDVAEYLVPPLTDAEVEEMIAVFGELAALGANPRSRELLRRPVVVDLLVRGGVTGTPLSDADAMEQVWAGLVRRRSRIRPRHAGRPAAGTAEPGRPRAARRRSPGGGQPDRPGRA